MVLNLTGQSQNSSYSKNDDQEQQISSDMLFHIRNTVVVPFFGKSDFLNHYWGYPKGPQGLNGGSKRVKNYQTSKNYDQNLKT